MLISVIIPTFNRAEKLRNCLRSLENQTYRNFEVIICDDGSTDNTKSVVDEFRHNLKIIYDYDNNFGGPARPRNKGIKLAKGEFLAFLDSDDWWYSNKLEICKKYMKDYDLIYHDLDIFNDVKKKGRLSSRELKGNIFQDFLIYDNPIFNSSVLLRKIITEKIGLISEDRNLIAVEDFDYWIRVSKITEKFKHLPLSLGAYHLGENISISIKQIDRDRYLLNKYIIELPLERQIKAKKFMAFRNARTYHRMGMFQDAIESYRDVSKGHHLNISLKSIVGLIGCYFKMIF